MLGTENGQLVRSSAMEFLPITQTDHYFPTNGYVIPSFANTLVGIGPLYNTSCYVTLVNHDVMFNNPRGHPILTGWWDHSVSPKLWHFALQPHSTQVPTLYAGT